jgi:hypothetical protein
MEARWCRRRRLTLLLRIQSELRREFRLPLVTRTTQDRLARISSTASRGMQGVSVHEPIKAIYS